MATGPPNLDDAPIHIDDVTIEDTLIQQFHERVMQNLLSPIDERIMDRLLGQEFSDKVRSRPAAGAYYGSFCGRVSAVAWKIYYQRGIKIWDGSWLEYFDRIVRDQNKHLLCWGYTATDIVSVYSMMCGWEDEYRPLSVAHVCFSCRFDLIGTCPNAEANHSCYGYNVENALHHIRQNGVPLEDDPVFDCQKFPAVTPPSRIGERIEMVLTLSDIDAVFFYIRRGPFAADLVVCSQLFEKTDKVYNGPLEDDVSFTGEYHSVIIVEIKWYKDDLVAVCQMSNGVLVGDDGIVYVSLTTYYMIKDNCQLSDGMKLPLRETTKPQSLLSNFVCLAMYENKNKSQGKRRVKDGEEEQGKKDQEEKMEESKPVSKTGQGGTSSSQLPQEAEPKHINKMPRLEFSRSRLGGEPVAHPLTFTKEALDEDGKLNGKKADLFGCTEYIDNPFKEDGKFNGKKADVFGCTEYIDNPFKKDELSEQNIVVEKMFPSEAPERIDNNINALGELLPHKVEVGRRTSISSIDFN